MLVLIKRVLLLACFAANAYADLPPNTEILACTTPQTLWAPYEYHDRKGNNELVGYNVDVMEEILKPYNIKLKHVIRPWKRCLESLKSGEFHMIWPTSLNEERRRDYLHSRHSYELTPAFFYLKSQFPSGLTADEVRNKISPDLRCGLLGYNYTNFGFNNEEIARTTKSHEALIARIHHKFCHAAFARLEIIAAAWMILEKPLLTEEISYQALPVPKERFHFLISKKHPQGKKLLNIINKGLDKLESSGRLRELLIKYIPNI
ncbi:substrate-binding periplasmic protein [Spartinivicinus poritis]|uniref:Transporter substrate-binding domain-containing protein n=1 Tax=Spartinivicinus poritis TaxID=2994640 RepID=A0ABT5UFH5_9GAMM|nr:transporter substrate-binding domain-containing protein [Spartinivicinus sp. A2-2]MDE1465138.1 transporter substrate-binding domain-containing protein [Spartinivicinus sp. A2-2]